MYEVFSILSETKNLCFSKSCYFYDCYLGLQRAHHRWISSSSKKLFFDLIKNNNLKLNENLLKKIFEFIIKYKLIMYITAIKYDIICVHGTIHIFFILFYGFFSSIEFWFVKWFTCISNSSWCCRSCCLNFRWINKTNLTKLYIIITILYP